MYIAQEAFCISPAKIKLTTAGLTRPQFERALAFQPGIRAAFDGAFPLINQLSELAECLFVQHEIKPAPDKIKGGLSYVRAGTPDQREKFGHIPFADKLARVMPVPF